MLTSRLLPGSGLEATATPAHGRYPAAPAPAMPPHKKNKRRRPEGKVAYFNRELSWLAFNRRVLDLAVGGRFPLLERLRFLSIVAANLDEFFEIRVAGLVQQVESGVTELYMDGLGPRELLRRIHSIATSLAQEQDRTWLEEIVPAMAGEGEIVKTPHELTRTEKKWVAAYFQEQVFPVLTPMAIDPAHPFPQLTNKALNILVWLDDPSTPQVETKMAVIPVPRILPRVVRLDGVNARSGKTSYMMLSDIIKMFARELFAGYKLKGAWAFRITRNSDLYIDEEEAENLLQQIEEELRKMRRGAAVRLEIEEGVHEELLSELLEANDLPREYVFRVRGPVNMMRLSALYDMIDRPDLKFRAFIPYTPPPLARREGLFNAIAREDHLLHHPYDAFTPVVDFLEQAARDPQVFAIKQTLYRTSGDSPVIEALKQASRNGKQVTALVELKARFDEANNIQWARELEETGVHVVYGLVGLKTHCKCLLVVRREGGGLRRYAHLGTGNYNPKTARAYTDLSFFTAREDVTGEVAELFNTLTGFARSPGFQKLLVAPFELHDKIQRLILREAANAKAGKPARIIAKMNSLIDQETIDNLYIASQAGVKIDLIVRGICGLVPGAKGLSETITVRSILGRYLEHSRIFYFENAGGEPDIYLGSADWMQRNFFRRIEALFPVEDERLRKRITGEYFPAMFKDSTGATALHPNGAYLPVEPGKDAEPFSSQEYFMERAEERRRADELSLEKTRKEAEATATNNNNT